MMRNAEETLVFPENIIELLLASLWIINSQEPIDGTPSLDEGLIKISFSQRQV
jgi:hypothetical protein